MSTAKMHWKDVLIIFLAVLTIILSIALTSRPKVWTVDVPEGYKMIQDDEEKYLIVPKEYYFQFDESGNMTIMKN